ncbi:MAG: SRPBCC family protein [Pirellulaceae bacterium]|nr:SRPBCC family protein [Planctomycetales bacterium]
MTLKYIVEFLVIWWQGNEFFTPVQFLNPLLSSRTELLHAAPPWVGWALFLWSLPFLWIAVSMSVRRAANANGSPWLGFLVLVPMVNYLTMLVLCLQPTGQSDRWMTVKLPQQQASANVTKGSVLGVLAGLMMGAAMLSISVYGLESYGAALFMGTPLMMGVITGYTANRFASVGYFSSSSLGTIAVLLAGATLLLFALEGLICVLMAFPMLLPLGALGGLMGKAIADATLPSARNVAASIAFLPLLALAEVTLESSPEYEVRSTVEIAAPPEVVWQHVIRFPELPPPQEWYFRTGIACPERATIVGTGVGAVRYCQFNTGSFVEPITAWEPDRRLAFDVDEQPPTMFELSLYPDVHPPHLDGYLRSKRGEFRLIPLPGNRTRLEGSTWYEFDMFPQSYWTLWSHLMIHRIHLRVLDHIKDLSESQQ